MVGGQVRLRFGSKGSASGLASPARSSASLVVYGWLRMMLRVVDRHGYGWWSRYAKVRAQTNPSTNPKQYNQLGPWSTLNPYILTLRLVDR